MLAIYFAQLENMRFLVLQEIGKQTSSKSFAKYMIKIRLYWY
jgi:hypothetical protein